MLFFVTLKSWKLYLIPWNPNVMIWPQLFKNWITLFSGQVTKTSAANAFRLLLLGGFLHRPKFHILLISFRTRFVWLRRVCPTYVMYWIAAYPVDQCYPPPKIIWLHWNYLLLCVALDQQGWKWIELEIIGPILSSSELFWKKKNCQKIIMAWSPCISSSWCYRSILCNCVWRYE